MRGTLHKTENGWQVWYHAKEDLFYGNTGVRILPLHDGDYFEVNRPGQYSEGKEVEFEIFDNREICNCACHRNANITHFVACCNDGYKTDNLGHVNYYAKLVDQKHTTMKGGEGWDKILNKAIEDKAEDFTNGHYHYRGKDAFIHGYKQGQEDVTDAVKKQISDFTIDLKECTSNYVKQNCEGAIFGLNRLLQALNKQDSDWLTMKEGDITINFKPMPEFDEPNIHNEYPTKLHQLQIQAAEACFRKYPNNELLYPTDELKDAYKAGVIDGIREWRLDSYNPPTKKQDNE